MTVSLTVRRVCCDPHAVAMGVLTTGLGCLGSLWTTLHTLGTTDGLLWVPMPLREEGRGWRVEVRWEARPRKGVMVGPGEEEAGAEVGSGAEAGAEAETGV